MSDYLQKDSGRSAAASFDPWLRFSYSNFSLGEPDPGAKSPLDSQRGAVGMIYVPDSQPEVGWFRFRVFFDRLRDSGYGFHTDPGWRGSATEIANFSVGAPSFEEAVFLLQEFILEKGGLLRKAGEKPPSPADLAALLADQDAQALVAQQLLARQQKRLDGLQTWHEQVCEWGGGADAPEEVQNYRRETSWGEPFRRAERYLSSHGRDPQAADLELDEVQGKLEVVIGLTFEEWPEYWAALQKSKKLVVEAEVALRGHDCPICSAAFVEPEFGDAWHCRAFRPPKGWYHFPGSLPYEENEWEEPVDTRLVVAENERGEALAALILVGDRSRLECWASSGDVVVAGWKDLEGSKWDGRTPFTSWKIREK